MYPLMSNSTEPATVDGTEKSRRSEPTGSGLLSINVLKALADAKGVEPDETGVQLYHHIDTEALNRLHRHYADMDGAFWSIEFAIDGLEFVVRADGTVSVR